MQINKLTDSNLLKKTEEAVAWEKNQTAMILRLLYEVDQRKLYTEVGASSLFKYCIEILDYSEMEASIRIQAMRLIQTVPEVEEKIKQGKISLTNAAKVQTFFRQEKATSSKEKQIIVEAIEGKSTRAVDKLLNQKRKISPPKKVTVVINEKILKKMERVKKQLGEVEDVELIEILLDQKIREIDESKSIRKSAGPKKRTRYITREVKELVNNRSNGQCEATSPITGKRCREKRSLEFDHIMPFAMGGANSVANIRHLCRACNQRQAVVMYGQSKMGKYFFAKGRRVSNKG